MFLNPQRRNSLSEGNQVSRTRCLFSCRNVNSCIFSEDRLTLSEPLLMFRMKRGFESR